MVQPTLAEALAYVEARGREAPVGLGVDVADLKKVMQVIMNCARRLRKGHVVKPQSPLALEISRIAKEVGRARRGEAKEK